jgi:DNA-binding MarR family transcriptional regulator
MTENKKPKSYTSLHRLAFSLQQSSDELLLNQTGVGLSHARIMGELGSITPVSQRNLAKQLRQTEANISRQIRIMQRQGLVNIIKSPKDGRERQITLTVKGSELNQKLDEILNTNYRSLLARLDKNESATFKGIINKLAGPII